MSCYAITSITLLHIKILSFNPNKYFFQDGSLLLAFFSSKNNFSEVLKEASYF